MINVFIRMVIIVISFIGPIFWISSCAVNPVTGKQELMLLSESDEINLGRNTDVEIVKQYGLNENAKLTAYLNESKSKRMATQIVVEKGR